MKDVIVALLMMKIRHQNADYSASPLTRDAVHGRLRVVVAKKQSDPRITFQNVVDAWYEREVEQSLNRPKVVIKY